MRGRLGRNVLASMANAGTGLGLALITTPLILHHVGTSGYGVWTIATSFVLYLAIAEAGFGPATQRFIAVAHGRGDVHAASRILWSTLLVYAAAGLLAGGLLQLLADDIIGVFDIPAGLQDDGVTLLRIVGAAFALALVSIALGNVQMGLERFVGVAVATLAGSVTFLAAIVTLVALDAGLAALGYAVLTQQAVMLVLRAAALRDVVRSGPVALISGAELRELVAFSAKLQLSVLSLLINGQSDKVVTGLVAPAATVGQLGVAAQVGEAGRIVAASALTPMITRLTVLVGMGDRERLHREYGRLNRLWLVATIGATAIGAGALHPLLVAWLGDGYEKATLFGEFLVVAYGIGLLTGTRVAYLRAINEIGPEATTGAVTIALNVAFTVPLAIAFGAVGVVAGTLAAYTLATVFMGWRFRPYAPPAPATPPRELVRAAALALLCAAAALGWGLAVVAVLPAGVALLPAAAGALAAFVLYVAAATRTRPTPSAFRALIAATDPA